MIQTHDRNDEGWSTSPSEPGWYWLYSKHDIEPMIVLVTDDSDGELLCSDKDGRYVAVKDMHFPGQWKQIPQVEAPPER